MLPVALRVPATPRQQPNKERDQQADRSRSAEAQRGRDTCLGDLSDGEGGTQDCVAHPAEGFTSASSSNEMDRTGEHEKPADRIEDGGGRADSGYQDDQREPCKPKQGHCADNAPLPDAPARPQEQRLVSPRPQCQRPAKQLCGTCHRLRERGTATDAEDAIRRATIATHRTAQERRNHKHTRKQIASDRHILLYPSSDLRVVAWGTTTLPEAQLHRVATVRGEPSRGAGGGKTVGARSATTC